MKYDCKLFSLSDLPVGPFGLIMSCCDRCCNQDCSNPIVNKDVSLFGVVKSEKVFMKATGFYIVADCEGFMPCEEEREV